MRVQELIDILKTFDPNMKVMDDFYMEVTSVYKTTWVDSNYPYDRPDEDIVVIS